MSRHLVALWIGLLVVGGCAHTIDATHLGFRATLAEPAAAPPTGTPFTVTKRAWFFFWGVVRGGQPDADDVLASQLIEGTGVADLRIRIRSRWNDILLTVLTGGLIVPRSVTYEGVIVPR